jgi:hypothetical protein
VLSLPNGVGRGIEDDMADHDAAYYADLRIMPMGVAKHALTQAVTGNKSA